MSSAALLIQKSISLENHPYSVVFDDKFIARRGYWLCKLCKSSFDGLVEDGHASSCLLKDTKNANVIYVFGPHVGAWASPFSTEELQKIKEALKNGMPQTAQPVSVPLKKERCCSLSRLLGLFRGAP